MNRHIPGWIPILVILTAMLIVPILSELGWVSRFGWMVRPYRSPPDGYALVLLMQPSSEPRLYVQNTPFTGNLSQGTPYATLWQVNVGPCSPYPECSIFPVTAQPTRVPYVDRINTTIVFTFLIPSGVKGFYWLDLSWFCPLQAVAIGLDPTQVNATDFPNLDILGGPRLCPPHVHSFYGIIQAYSGMNVISVKLS